jgi:hypothetical protein
LLFSAVFPADVSCFAESVANQTKPTYGDAAPAVSSIITEFTTASGQLKALQAAGTVKRQSSTDIASLTAGLVSEVTTAVAGLGSSSSDNLVSALLPGLDGALDAVLVDLENLLAGVLTLVAQL